MATTQKSRFRKKMDCLSSVDQNRENSEVANQSKASVTRQHNGVT